MMCCLYSLRRPAGSLGGLLNGKTDYTKASTMKQKSLRAGVGLFVMRIPAFAYHCPMDMQKIDAALAADPPLSRKQLAEVKHWRSREEALHRAGAHRQWVEVLGKPMAILKIN